MSKPSDRPRRTGPGASRVVCRTSARCRAARERVTGVPCGRHRMRCAAAVCNDCQGCAWFVECVSFAGESADRLMADATQRLLHLVLDYSGGSTTSRAPQSARQLASDSVALQISPISDASGDIQCHTGQCPQANNDLRAPQAVAPHDMTAADLRPSQLPCFPGPSVWTCMQSGPTMGTPQPRG